MEMYLISIRFYKLPDYLTVAFDFQSNCEDISINGNYYDCFESDVVKKFFKKYPSLCALSHNGQDGELILMIDVESGKIVNFPKGFECDSHFETVKLCDCGTYRLLGLNDEILAEYEGYVPKMLCTERPGYGDYLEFIVDKNGVIKNWKFNESLVKDFLENCTEDE